MGEINKNYKLFKVKGKMNQKLEKKHHEIKKIKR